MSEESHLPKQVVLSIYSNRKPLTQKWTRYVGCSPRWMKNTSLHENHCGKLTRFSAVPRHRQRWRFISPSWALPSPKQPLGQQGSQHHLALPGCRFNPESVLIASSKS
ncbi:unnamed protein product [Caretta caretta]